MTEIITNHNHDTHEHEHHGHAHQPEDFAADGLLALHAEDLYLRLAYGQRRISEPAANPQEQEVRYDTTALRQRLGAKAPDLTETQERDVEARFAHQFSLLPRSELHSHDGHGHADDGCGKRHGPIRKTLERLERGALSRVRSHRVKVAVELMFRASFFTMCPGDDLAAIGLQAYGSISGQHQEHHEESHTEVNAILPTRPRIELQRGKAIVRLPLEQDPVPHMPLDQPKAVIGMPAEQPKNQQVLQPKNVIPEKAARSLRRRFAALGLLAIAAFGGMAADTSEKSDQPESQAAAEVPRSSYRIELPPLRIQPSYPIELPPLTVQQPRPDIFDQTVSGGDSEWSLAENAVRAADMRVTPQRSYTIARYIAGINKSTNPNPDMIVEGQLLKVPNATLTKQLLATPLR